MLMDRRIVTLIVLTLISTSTPAVYQVGIQPRVEGAKCDISITSLELDEDLTTPEMAVFNAYLRIDNHASVDVILSRLSLDVYHHSSITGRYEMIGTLNTSQEYRVYAHSFIQSVKTTEGVVTINAPTEDKQTVVAILGLKQDEKGGHSTTEAVGELISKGYVSLRLKGIAEVGPFKFKYERYQTLSLNFWDPNFVLEDIFPYYDNNSINWEPKYTGPNNYNTSGVGKYVLHLKMHNPSGIPMILQEYSFSLVDENNTVRARAINSTFLYQTAYDPDLISNNSSRKKIVETYMHGSNNIILSKDPSNWTDIFIGLDFNDPNYNNPDYIVTQNEKSRTRDNIAWFFNKLLVQPDLTGMLFRGRLKLIIGIMQDQNYRGISIEVGSDNPSEKQFTLYNVQMHQKHYAPYDDEEPKSLQELMAPEKIKVDNVTVDSANHNVAFSLSSKINFTNPYRIEMKFTDFGVNYYRVNKSNPTDPLQTYLFGDNSALKHLHIVNIGRAYSVENTSSNTITLYSNVTQIDVNFSLSYDTNTFINNTGISKVFSDLNINPQVLNWSNPFWLMSPSFMNVDPLIVVKYLIENGLDPLMLLNKSAVTEKYYTDGDAYFPLHAMFFGSRDRNSNFDQESEDMNAIAPRKLTDYFKDNMIMRPISVGNTWSVFDQEDRQWEFASRSISYSSGTWLWDSDRNVAALQRVNGLILTSFHDQGISSNIPGDTIPPQTWWRIYSMGGSHDYDYNFGYMYDYEENLRNYYICYDPNGGGTTGMAFAQNITLMDPQSPGTPMGETMTADDIVKATISVSYRYPAGGAWDGLLGLGKYQSLGGSTYTYDYTVTPGLTVNSSVHMFSSASDIYGLPLLNPDNDHEWHTKVIDVTDVIKNAITEYRTGGHNINSLKFEFAFGTRQGINTFAQFDDAVFKIEYKKPGPSPFEIKNLFKYTEQNNPVDGNMWNLLNDIGFNATNFASFIANDFGKGITTSGQEPNVASFFAGSKVSLSNLTYLMNQAYTSFNASEPTNFFEMLNQSEYYIPAPDSGSTRTYISGLGYRDKLNNYWVIKDPYKASKAINDALVRNIHVDSSGHITLSGMYGEELWMLFNNLGVYLPWIIMYLYGHGWSKDDIFDMLEALGFASEVKADYSGDNAKGILHTRQHVQASINILGELINTHVDFDFDMGKTINDGYQELFRALFADGDIHTYGGVSRLNSRPLVSTSGTFSNPTPWNGDAPGKFEIPIPPPIGPIVIRFTVYLTITPENFELHIWMQDIPGGICPPSEYDPDNNPYLKAGSTLTTDGLNDAGSKILGSLVRQNYRFADAPFVSTGGDPMGLFQFLDQFYFTTINTSSPIPPYNPDYPSDYSSYTLLDYFNVKSKDFVDLITGYSFLYNDFDHNGNGKVDDWRPPIGDINSGGYGGGYNLTLSGVGNHKSSYPGWGTNFWDQRIFWDDLNQNHPYNGGVMWSDSPSLLYINPTNPNDPRTQSHQRGDVYTPTDDPSEGAPPCVNLIDMLAWLSRTTGHPDPDKFFKWILGELGPEYYQMVNPYDRHGQLWGINSYDHGIGLDKSWAMLQNCTFNVTGMFNWLENVKKAKPFKLMWSLDNFTGGNEAPDPKNLLFFALNPNLVMTPNGHIQFIYHDSLGATAGQSRQFLWQLYNASYWQQKGYELWNYNSTPLSTLPYKLFERFRELEINDPNNPNDDNLAFNLFYMLINLNINAGDWWNDIQYDPSVHITPLNVLYSSDKLNITKLLIAAKNAGLSSTIKINGSINIWISNLNLVDPTYWPNTMTYTMDLFDFSASYYFSDFINPDALYRGSFVILY